MYRQPTITLMLLLASFTAYSQTVENGNFDSDCKDEKNIPCPWSLSWGAADCCQLQSENDNNFLSMVSAKKEAVRFVEQSVNIEETTEIVIINLSGKIRTKGIDGKGASLHLQLFNTAGDYIAKKDMAGSRSGKWIAGDTEWTSYSIQIICPIGISKVNLGVIFYGQGTADFDELEMKIEEIKEGNPSAIAKSFIDEVIEIIAKHSLHRDDLDIEKIHKKALSIVGDAQSTEDCQIGMDYLLASLQQFGDHHSFFMTPEEAKEWKTGGEESNPSVKYPQTKRIGSIGYISVPGFHSSNPELILAYADSLQTGLQEMYDIQLQGWMVDLRPNDGGNTEPMVMGLGPLLDEGTLGALVDVNGEAEKWNYKNGSVFWEGVKGLTFKKPIQLPKKLPIAVLTGPATGSSGEIATISFVGNTATKSFGETTMGLTTGNGDFELSDGSILFLSSTRMADRNGNVFSAGVTPDVEIKPTKNTETDVVLEAAKAWLLTQKK